MDDVDLQIIKKLIINSRIPFRQLAEEIGLSVGAVYKRVQYLVDKRIIVNFTARPSFSYLNAIIIYILGTSKLKSIDEILDDLEEDPHAFFLGVSSGNYLYMVAVLKNISDMNNVSRKLSNICKIDDPLILINNFQYQKVYGTLSKLDYQIMKSLNQNSRKSVSEVADETGLSSKTVSRHINDMMKNNLVTFSIDYHPLQEQDIIAVFHANISSDTEMSEIFNKIHQAIPKNLLYIRTFSNFPLMLTVHVSVNILKNVKEFENKLKEIGLKDIVPRIVYNGYYFKSWLDEF